MVEAPEKIWAKNTTERFFASDRRINSWPEYVRADIAERENAELRKERDEARLWESKYKADLDISAQWHTEEEARAETAERQLAEQKKLRKEDMLAFEATQMKRDEQNILLRHQLAERDADLARKNEALLGIANSIRDGLTENSLPDHRIKIGEGNHIEGGWLLGPGAALIRNMLVAIRDLAEQAASAALAGSGDGWREMSSAPKNGTFVILKVRPGVAEDDGWTPFADSSEPYITIGFNALAHTLEDVWQFVGWDWCHDCFTDGAGTAEGWKPFPASALRSLIKEDGANG